jgi:hypothetical protein
MGNDISTGLFMPANEFDGPEMKSGEGRVLIDATVHTVRIYAKALVWITALLCVASLFLSLVAGASLGGTPVSFSALPHIVWQVSNILVLMYLIDALGFDSHYDMDSTVSALLVAFIFVLIAIAINAVHWASLLLECIDGTSTFYIQGFGFLLSLTIGVAVVTGIMGWIAARIWIYRSTLYYATKAGWRPGVLSQELDAYAAVYEGRTNPTAPTPSPQSDTQMYQQPPQQPQTQAKIHARMTTITRVGPAIGHTE